MQFTFCVPVGNGRVSVHTECSRTGILRAAGTSYDPRAYGLLLYSLSGPSRQDLCPGHPLAFRVLLLSLFLSRHTEVCLAVDVL